jgi:hypothetical protein
MKVRFLRQTDSDVAGFPFRVGQIVDVETVTPEIEAWIAEERAEIVREEPEVETAMLEGGKKKRAGRPRSG